MKIVTLATAIGVALTGMTGMASADPWKDESGSWRGGGYYDGPRYERRAFKEEYRRGRCKIERKWDDDEYKEEIKCKRGGYYRY
ncbi:hypothetical protein M1D34_28680 (plasmid) [Ensifer sp. D2-11]